MNLLTKLYKFMYNRYGVDELYKFNFYLLIILLIINLFTSSSILLIIEILLIIIMIYRSMSKNIQKRQKENQIYLNYKNKIINIFKRKSDKDYIYKKCSKCKTILKLPRPTKKGIKHTTCPTCKKRITVLIFRKKKVEIIRKDDKKRKA